MEWIKDCTRKLSEDEVIIWKVGEQHFSRMLGIKYKSEFHRDGEMVEVYYEATEGDIAHEAIRKFLRDPRNFDNLCDDFVDLIEQKHEIQAKMMRALIIFDEIDNYPDIASEDIRRRLIRIRTSTHEESYK